MLFFSFLEWLDAPVRLGIFVSRTGEKLGRTCDHIGRTLEPCTLLRYYHDHPTAGHLGITKTLARLKLRFFWPKMASEVKKYVTSCTVCQLTKPSQRKPAGLMVPIGPQKPWEYVGVDFVGPLPRTFPRQCFHFGFC